MSGQLYDPGSFIPRKESPLLIQYKNSWIPKAGLDTTEKRKYLAMLEIEPRLLGYTAGSLVCIPTELSRLTLVFCWQRNWKLDGLTMKCAELPLISSEQTYTHAVAKCCSIQITIQIFRSNTEPYMKSMLMEE